MKKFWHTLGLLVVILLTFSFIILRLLAQGSADNFFNQKYRAIFDHSRIMRQALSLKDPGDARFDYLSGKPDKILVEVDSMQGLTVPDSAMQLLSQRIQAVTGKQVEIVNSNNDIPYEQSVSEDEITTLAEKYENFADTSQPYIYLLYLSRSATESDLLGETYEDNGIILFADELAFLTQRNPSVFSDYIESTALHEFGHQLGLQHNNNAGCIMNPTADRAVIVFETSQTVVTDFCDYEKNLIKQQ